MRRLLVAAAERGEAGSALLERAKSDTQDGPQLDPQQLEKELLLAREAVNCKWHFILFTGFIWSFLIVIYC